MSACCSNYPDCEHNEHRLNMKKSEEDGRPQTPNEKWNYIIIVGLTQIAERMMAGRLEHPKTKENIKYLVRMMLGIYQMYRNEASISIQQEIEKLEKKFLSLGKYIYYTRIKTLNQALDIFRNIEPKTPNDAEVKQLIEQAKQSGQVVPSELSS